MCSQCCFSLFLICGVGGWEGEKIQKTIERVPRGTDMGAFGCPWGTLDQESEKRVERPQILEPLLVVFGVLTAPFARELAPY